MTARIYKHPRLLEREAKEQGMALSAFLNSMSPAEVTAGLRRARVAREKFALHQRFCADCRNKPWRLCAFGKSLLAGDAR